MLPIKGAPADHEIQTVVYDTSRIRFGFIFMGCIVLLYQTRRSLYLWCCLRYDQLLLKKGQLSESQIE